jgi:hypothetical protein
MKDAERSPGAGAGQAEGETTMIHLHRFVNGTAVGQDRPQAEAESPTELIRQAAVRVVAESDPKVIVPQRAAPLTADELLGAVTYCYVKGLFSSADIEEGMRRDPEFRAALNGVVPDPATIRKFRRLNRAAIQFVLEKYYAYLRRQQKLAGTGAIPGPTPTGEENTAVFVKREASACLDKATFVDGMSDY